MKATLTLPASGRAMAAVALTTALAACGAPATQAGAAPGATSGFLPVTSCDTQNLKVVRDSHLAWTSDGDTYLPIDFVNDSTAPCSLTGYPRVIGFSGPHQRNGSAAELPGALAPLVLKPNYTAHAWVQIRNVSGQRPAGCLPFNGQGLQVFAPGSTTHAWITYPFRSCVPANYSILGVDPIQQGMANPAILP